MIRTVVCDGKAEYEALGRLAGRGGAPGADVEGAVREIIEAVRTEGDAAVSRYAQRFDGARDGIVRALSRDALGAAYKRLPEGLAGALSRAAENIRAYHAHQAQQGYEHTGADGVIIGQAVRGLDRVGIYVPGGTAAYPSTVLMNAIPARIAGVGEIVMATPPREGADAILGAAWLAGVDRVALMGGAHAVAALAYGTETLPRVDKIVGPGNVYVATAKRLLYGVVDIDMIAGPSEVLVCADGSANASFVAADLLSQAEHDADAAAVLVTTDADLASRVAGEIERQLGALERSGIARKSIDANGLVIVCGTEDKMLELANLAAPEHLELAVKDPMRLLPRVRNAGSVFIGEWTPEPVGDYYAGTNHVLPTSGTARFASPLGVYDFVKRMSYTAYTHDALLAVKHDIIAIGETEGLTAHANAVRVRFGGGA